MDKEKWKQAQKLAKVMYEEDDNGDWEEADKYEREDYVWAAYEKIIKEDLQDTVNSLRCDIERLAEYYEDIYMYVWILATSERDDEFCEHDSNIVTVYSQEHFDEALKHFEKLCKDRTENGYEISRYENKLGYYFSAKLEDYNWVKMKNVSLEKKVVM